MSEAIARRARLLSASSADDIRVAVASLREGGLVAFPTETVYGLGADALNEHAVQRVFAAKGRPSDNPLIVHLGDIEAVDQFVVAFPEKAKRLSRHVWPGPLTIVLERNDLVPDIVAAGLDTIALRVPRHPATLELLRQFGGGIVGPSANTSGKPSPTTAQHVFDDLSERIDYVLDGGATEYGLESTVVDFTDPVPVMLRRGSLTKELIESVIGPIVIGEGKALDRSPGTKHRHYAPKAKIEIVSEGNARHFLQVADERTAAGEVVGTMTHSTVLNLIDSGVIRTVRFASKEDMAKSLYGEMRAFDASGITTILVEACDENGIGLAIMDRLRRAAHVEQ